MIGCCQRVRLPTAAIISNACILRSEILGLGTMGNYSKDFFRIF